MLSVSEQMDIILKGAEEIIGREDLEDKLKKAIETGEPIHVKLGLDPSSPDIHIGHAVVLRKIRQIQDLGHVADIIIGDFTGMIGDPTGRSKTRKQLTEAEVLENARTYQEQVFKILDRSKTNVHFNSEWLAKLTFKDVIMLASKVTVARMLERDDFEKRYKANEAIGLHEFFYPLMQSYDSVALKSDIELGGTDQRFNILMGRNIQKDYGIEKSQAALFMPLLEGIDGSEKMSKSLGNYVGINEPADVMYRKVMQIPDNLIVKYYNLATDVHPARVREIEASLKDPKTNPRDVKMGLAREITRLYHGEEEAKKAETLFVSVFQKSLVPEDIPELTAEDLMTGDGSIDLIRAIAAAGLAPSNSEARRLIKQGGVKINGEKCLDFAIPYASGTVVAVGKGKFVKIK